MPVQLLIHWKKKYMITSAGDKKIVSVIDRYCPLSYNFVDDAQCGIYPTTK